MNNPLQRLKQLPWMPLFQVAIATALIVTILEMAILFSLMVPSVKSVLGSVLMGPLGLVLVWAIAIGVGALAVFLLEQLHRHLITTGSLWALILCLAVVFLLRGLLPIPVGLFEMDQTRLICMVVGVFWKGRPYWRSFRRF